jgi:hypothetical protein
LVWRHGSGERTVYVFDSKTGALRHTLFSPELTSMSNFGESLAVTDDGDVVVGAWWTSVDGFEAAGHAYLFDGQNGRLLMEIPNPEPESFAAFDPGQELPTCSRPSQSPARWFSPCRFSLSALQFYNCAG